MNKEAELAALKGLVRELEPAMLWIAESHYGSAYRDKDKVKTILVRPEVVRILEGG